MGMWSLVLMHMIPGYAYNAWFGFSWKLKYEDGVGLVTKARQNRQRNCEDLPVCLGCILRYRSDSGCRQDI